MIHHKKVPTIKPQQKAPFTWKCKHTATITRFAIATTTSSVISPISKMVYLPRTMRLISVAPASAVIKPIPTDIAACILSGISYKRMIVNQSQCARNRSGGVLTLVKKRPTGGTIPKNANPAPAINNDGLPSKKLYPFCCIDTAKKIDTDVGGAIMNGVSVRKAPIIQPIAHVTVVAIIEASSS
jgi:hypothetical protein